MNVLVTGGAGYIGSHVVKELLETGYNVVVIDNLQKGHAESVLGGQLIRGDLSDEALLHEIFEEQKIDAVIHLAADSLVGESMKVPKKYYKNNLCNGLNLLNVMVAHGTRYMVFSSTAAVYGDPLRIPIDEEHPRCPTNVYGETKATFENALAWYDVAYGIKSISLRYFNAAGADLSGRIGEKHSPETHLIPIILDVALGRRKHIEIFGTDYDTADGTCVRDYIHVTDLARAHILSLDALTQGAEGGAYNLGNQVGFSVKEVIKATEEVVGKSIPTIEGSRRAGDPAVLVASSEKIKRELGWNPEFHNLKTIIETAWQWHKKG
jgi:UDP-glucose 4-epimerase